MENPKITLDGKEYTAKPPKMGLLRKVLKFNSAGGRIDTEGGYDDVLEIIALAFGDSQITSKSLDESMQIGDLMPTVQAIGNWVGELLGAKTGALPNPQQPAGSV